MLRTSKSKKSSKKSSRRLERQSSKEKRGSKRKSPKRSTKQLLERRSSKEKRGSKKQSRPIESTYSLIIKNRLYHEIHSFWQIIFGNKKLRIDTINFVGTICESKKLYISSSSYLYDQMLNELDKYKIDKIKFMNNEYDKSMKYITYALEECDTVDKFLSSINKIKPSNKHDCINIMETIDNLLYNNLQKHTFIISTISKLNIDKLNIDNIY